MPINKYARYQNNFPFTELYPTRKDGVCRCGCNRKLQGRKKYWFDDGCSARSWNRYHVIQGSGNIIRAMLVERDGGQCVNCGKVCADNEWDADHILEVKNGGGGCELSNLQTLCKLCHKAKTKTLYKKTTL